MIRSRLDRKYRKMICSAAAGLMLMVLQTINVFAVDLAAIAEYEGKSYVTINDNVPDFSDSDMTTEAFEYYSAWDSLGRCGTAYANICPESMPTEERGEIGAIKPSGWHTVKYDVIEDLFLYNRCHLIGYQLAGENDNELNLITGTRYLNIEGMLPFENQVASYVENTGNHVLYRVTPIYDGDNLVASGVQMEAKSVEDKGNGIAFNVYCYNVQPGVWIDYATGESALAENAPNMNTGSEQEESSQSINTESEQEAATETENTAQSVGVSYVFNTNTKKFHYLDCKSVDQMKEKNKQEFSGTRDEAISMGYAPCGNCNP